MDNLDLKKTILNDIEKNLKLIFKSQSEDSFHKVFVNVCKRLGGLISGNCIEFSEAFNLALDTASKLDIQLNKIDLKRLAKKAITKGMNEQISSAKYIETKFINIESEKTDLEILYGYDKQLIDKTIYETLPTVFREFLYQFREGKDRDTVFISCLPVIGQAFINYWFKHDSSKVYPLFLTYITGYAATGKGNAKWGIKLAEIIGEYLKGLNPDFELLISGNISKTALGVILKQNKGCGIIAETETDSIAKNENQDWGGISIFGRKSFHHESESIERVGEKNKENVKINLKNLRFSFLFTSTPNQTIKIVPNVIDGFSSRILYYNIYDESGWENKLSKDANIIDLREFDKYIIDRISRKEVEVTFNEDLHDFYNVSLARLYNFYSNLHPDIAKSYIKRMGLMCLRLSVIFAILSKKPQIKTIVVNIENLEPAINLIEILLNHSFDIGSIINRQYTVKLMTNKQRIIYNEVKDNYDITRDEVLNIAKKYSISNSTVSRLLNNKILFQLVQGGKYRKAI